METRTYTVYKFDELPEEGKRKALMNYSDINIDHDWWNYTYDDAENIGLKITEYDGYRCKGKLTLSGENCAKSIMANHGVVCETYKTAKDYLDNLSTLESLKDNHIDINAALEDLEEDFKHSLLEDYRIMLDKEYEHLTSDEAIIETIQSNDYDFTIDGKID